MELSKVIMSWLDMAEMRRGEGRLWSVVTCLRIKKMGTRGGSIDSCREIPRKERTKEIPYKEGILKDIGAPVGYTVLYRRGGYLSGGTNLDTPRGRYTKAVTNSIARGL